MLRFTSIRILQAVCLAALVCLLVKNNPLHGGRRYELFDDPKSAPVSSSNFYGHDCSPFTSGVLDDVTIVLKMGAGEVLTRLPLYLERFVRCEPDLLLFSDRNDNYKGYEIHDALANLDSKYWHGNPDFEVYDSIQSFNDTGEKTDQGWLLDKYKFLPIMEFARHMRPESHWFVFIELDTYVNFDNMHRFLARFNHKKTYYFGSPVRPVGKPAFAHGGTGFVLSSATMDRLTARGRTFIKDAAIPGTHMFGMDVRKECCGDDVLAMLLDDIGITLNGYWPMFNGEKPDTIRFDEEQWCEAILTLHHLSNEDFVSLERWESSFLRTPSRPLTFEEIFTYIEPSLRDRKDDWTNLSEDDVNPEENAGESFEACSAACSRDPKCVQFELVGSTCHTSTSIRLGRSHPEDAEERRTSGWMVERIHEFKDRHSPCRGAHMVQANP